MASFKVVVVDVASNGAPGFLDVMPFRQVDFLILEGPEPALDLDIVTPTAFAVHALVSSVSSNSHPTIQRLCQSMIAVRYRNPCFIGMQVMSMDHASSDGQPSARHPRSDGRCAGDR